MSSLPTNPQLVNLLVDHDVRLYIPQYQRPYAWEEEQWQRFVDDLADQTTSSLPDERKQYYLGHFLFESTPDGRFGIIDGQQRFTTSFLFCAAALSLLSSDSDSPLISTLCRVLKRGSSPRLEVVRHDRTLYTTLINRAVTREHRLGSDDATSAQDRMRSTVDFFTTWLQEQGSDDPTVIERLLHTLLHAQITTYTVTDQVQAAQLFELQNDRGRALTELEKLKSFFIYRLYLQLPAADLDEACRAVHHSFERIYQAAFQITDVTDDDVLRFYFYAQHGGYRREGVLPVVRQLIQQGELSADQMQQFCQDLSEAFQFIVAFQARKQQPEVSNLLLLNSHTIIYPFLLRGYFLSGQRVKSEAARWEYLSQLCQVLELLAFRVEVIGSRARINDRLSDLLVNLPESVTEFRNQLRDILEQSWYWRDEAFTMQLAELSYHHRQSVYLLWQYERDSWKRGYEVAISDVNLSSLEHIAPQKEPSGRYTGYGRYNETRFNEPVRNMLGNLALITGRHNSSLSNGKFNEKLVSYADSPLSHLRELCDEFKGDDAPRWDRASIEKRHAKLVAWAVERWQL